MCMRSNRSSNLYDCKVSSPSPPTTSVFDWSGHRSPKRWHHRACRPSRTVVVGWPLTDRFRHRLEHRRGRWVADESRRRPPDEHLLSELEVKTGADRRRSANEIRRAWFLRLRYPARIGIGMTLWRRMKREDEHKYGNKSAMEYDLIAYDTGQQTYIQYWWLTNVLSS